MAIAALPVGGYAALATAWLAIGLTAIWARVGAVRVNRAALIAIPFALAALPLVFTRTGDPWGSFAIGSFTLSVSGEGVRMFSTILLKSWLSVQVALLLAFTTPFHELIDALRELRLPRLMVAIISFMYRYLTVVAGEATRMSRARAARSAVPAGGRGGGSMAWRARVTGSMVGSLFLRSYERSERIYAAMQSRGFDANLRHLAMRRLEMREVVVLAVVVALLVAFVWAAHVVHVDLASLPR